MLAIIDPPGLIIGAIIGVTAGAVAMGLIRLGGYLFRKVFRRNRDIRYEIQTPATESSS